MSELQLRDVYREVSDAFGGLSVSFKEMKMAIDTFNNQLEKSAYLLGIRPLPRHLRAWHVARRYKQLVSRGDKE